MQKDNLVALEYFYALGTNLI